MRTKPGFQLIFLKNTLVSFYHLSLQGAVILTHALFCIIATNLVILDPQRIVCSKCDTSELFLNHVELNIEEV